MGIYPGVIVTGSVVVGQHFGPHQLLKNIAGPVIWVGVQVFIKEWVVSSIEILFPKRDIHVDA